MVIDWTAAPEGTTHATINGGEPYWYKLDGSKALCWSLKMKEWAPSFFLTVDEIAETGLRLYANGEQSELVMLREQRDALWSCLNGITEAWIREDEEAMPALMVSAAQLIDNSGPGMEGSANG